MTQQYLGQIIDTSQESGDDLAARLNGFDVGYKSNQSGSTRPAGIAPGGLWSREVSAGVYALMLYDGGGDRVIGLAQVTQADQLAYFTGPSSQALTTLTPFARTLIDDANAAAARSTLEVTYATQAEAEAGTAANRMMTPQRTAQRIAAQIATPAEALAGTANDKLMTPIRVREAVPAALNATGAAPVYACRAWVAFKGTSPVSILASGNVSSVTRTAAGVYRINFVTSLPDADYSVSGTAGDPATSGRIVVVPDNTRLSSSVVVETRLLGGTISTSDVTYVGVAIFR